MLVATARRERCRPPAHRRHTAKPNNGGVLQRRCRCGCWPAVGCPAWRRRANGRTPREGRTPRTEAAPGARCARLSPIPRRSGDAADGGRRSRQEADSGRRPVAGELGYEFFFLGLKFRYALATWPTNWVRHWRPDDDQHLGRGSGDA